MADVKVEKTKSVTLAYVEHVGSYDAIPFQKYMEKLYGRAKDKHIRPGLFSLGIYYDSPNNTPPAKRRCEVGHTNLWES